MDISLQKLIDSVAYFIVSLGMIAFPFGSYFGVKYYGFPVIALLGAVWFLMCFPIDIGLGYRVARRNGNANSGIMGDGLVTKLTLFVLVAIALFVVGVLSYVSTIESVGKGASIGCLIVLLILMFREFMSIVENMAVLEPEEKDRSLWLRLANMMGIGVDIARKKIEKKIDDITKQ